MTTTMSIVTELQDQRTELEREVDQLRSGLAYLIGYYRSHGMVPVGQLEELVAGVDRS